MNWLVSQILKTQTVGFHVSFRNFLKTRIHQNQMKCNRYQNINKKNIGSCQMK